MSADPHYLEITAPPSGIRPGAQLDRVAVMDDALASFALVMAMSRWLR